MQYVGILGEACGVDLVSLSDGVVEGVWRLRMSKLRRAIVFIEKTRGSDSGESRCFSFDRCERCLMTPVETSGGIAFPGCLLEADDATSITIAQAGLLMIFYVTTATRMFTILTRLHLLDW